MKYICLGYLDEEKWNAMPANEQEALMDACFAYDDILRTGGHFLGGEALQSHRAAVTLRRRDDAVTVTDGPYAETKEQLGGILILEARDLNHAIQLMSKHPGVKAGPFEIRPAEDLDQFVRDSEARRRAKDVAGNPPPGGRNGILQTTPESLRVTQYVHGGRDTVFQAWVDPQLVNQWLCPEECRVVANEAEVRIDGPYRESMRCDDRIHTVRGVYREIVPGRRLVFTHRWDEADAPETLVEVTFAERGDGTEVTLAQSGFRSAAAAEGHAEGWASALRNLAGFTERHHPASE